MLRRSETISRQARENYSGGLMKKPGKDSSEPEMFEAVAALLDDLVVVDPDVAIAGEYVDVRARLPIGVCLAAVRIAKSEMYAGEFLILEQDADHLRQAQIGAKSEFADPVTVFVGVAIVPEF